jgi:hypothetical protein
VHQALKGALDFETLETLLRETSLRIGAEVLEVMINSADEKSSPTMRQPDGRVLRYAGKREKTFVMVLGDITLQRACYTDGNGRGYFPLDEMLGFARDCLSPEVKRMIGHTASILSFSESSVMVRRKTERSSWRSSLVPIVEINTVSLLAMRDRSVIMGPSRVRLQVIWMKGFQILPGEWNVKHRGEGSIRRNDRWSSVMGTNGYGILPVNYFPVPLSSLTCSMRKGPSRMPLRRSLVHRVSMEQSAKTCRDELEAGNLDSIIGKLKVSAKKFKEARQCREYLLNNRDRLNYPSFRKMGLSISSGIVESGCKHVIGARVKQSGMHWTVRGANDIIALRCFKLNERFDTFMDWRKGA